MTGTVYSIRWWKQGTGKSFGGTVLYIQTDSRDWAEQSCLVSGACNFPFTSCRLEMEMVRTHIEILYQHIKSCISNTFLVFVVAPGHWFGSCFSSFLVTWVKSSPHGLDSKIRLTGMGGRPMDVTYTRKTQDFPPVPATLTNRA